MKPHCETDRRLVNKVAEIWVDGGGDAEGVDWMLSAIKERINELKQESTVLKVEDGE